jgi:Fic family protein
VHVEVQKKGNARYYYLVENLRLKPRGWKKVRVYLGKNLKEHELEKIKRKKTPEILRKFDNIRKSVDPLLVLISRNELQKLENIRNSYKKRVKKMDKLQYQNYYENFLTQFTYDTNAIEGSTVTLQETAMILFDKIVPEGKSIREINEVQNHKDAFDYMISYKGEISKAFVLRLHKMLMHNILWKYAGKFRNVQIYVRGADFIPAKPQDVEKEFKRLMLWYRSNKKKYHPVVVAAYFHHVFESIHPFRDGNGRVGRLLLNFILRKNMFPMLDIKYKNRSEYYKALQHANNKNLRPFVEIIINCLMEPEPSI